jgi:hypothetical protein
MIYNRTFASLYLGTLSYLFAVALHSGLVLYHLRWCAVVIPPTPDSLGSPVLVPACEVR